MYQLHSSVTTLTKVLSSPAPPRFIDHKCLLASSSDASNLDDEIGSLLGVVSVSQVRSGDGVRLWILADLITTGTYLKEVGAWNVGNCRAVLWVSKDNSCDY